MRRDVDEDFKNVGTLRRGMVVDVPHGEEREGDYSGPRGALGLMRREMPVPKDEVADDWCQSGLSEDFDMIKVDRGKKP